MMKRLGANDAVSIFILGDHYHHGLYGFQQDQTKAMELYARAADLGSSRAHNNLGVIYHEGGDLKKAKFHFEAAAMAGHEEARFNLGLMEGKCGNFERAVKHYMIAASAGDCHSMHHLRFLFGLGGLSRESINSALEAYNNSCTEIRSEARVKYISLVLERVRVGLTNHRYSSKGRREKYDELRFREHERDVDNVDL
jgi:TPR repeat protein